MWSADNDLLNLKKDYGITIPHLVDLQSKYRVGFPIGSINYAT